MQKAVLISPQVIVVKDDESGEHAKEHVKKNCERKKLYAKAEAMDISIEEGGGNFEEKFEETSEENVEENAEKNVEMKKGGNQVI